MGGPEALSARAQMWRTAHSLLEMAPEVVRPSFYWHSKLERLKQDPSPFQARVGASPNSIPAPAFQTASMTGQLLGYHWAPSDLTLSVESAKHFGSGVKDLAARRRESTIRCCCHILFFKRLYKHLKASQNIRSIWSTGLQFSSQTPLEMTASCFLL